MLEFIFNLILATVIFVSIVFGICLTYILFSEALIFLYDLLTGQVHFNSYDENEEKKISYRVENEELKHKCYEFILKCITDDKYFF
ncbi:MAG: hypothetical protein MJ180_02845 [Candidatus Gastranaerophilales bacterium]|nr:hypothetical protein [Candidatus Gastranaerophilales bacterium]